MPSVNRTISDAFPHDGSGASPLQHGINDTGLNLSVGNSGAVLFSPSLGFAPRGDPRVTRRGSPGGRCTAKPNSQNCWPVGVVDTSRYAPQAQAVINNYVL